MVKLRKTHFKLNFLLIFTNPNIINLAINGPLLTYAWNFHYQIWLQNFPRNGE